MIQLTNPITIPATPTQNADAIFVLTCNINGTQGPLSAISVYLSLCPMVSSTGVIFPDMAQDLYIPDLMAVANNNPTISSQLTSLYNSLEYLCQAQGLFGMSLATT